MNELHLFAGSGGGILGGILCGNRTVCAVELEPFCRSVLLQRQRDGMLPWFPIWDDVQTFDGTPWNGLVDIICGGFPCQDISCSGKGLGISGPHSGLWTHFARIIGEVRPRYVLVENSPILTLRGLGTVLGDLAKLGYDAQWGIVSAADAGAPHLRKRIWILGHSRSERLQPRWINHGGNDRMESVSTNQHAGQVANAPIKRRGKKGKLRPFKSKERTAGGGENVAHASGFGEREQADQTNPVANERHARDESLRCGECNVSDSYRRGLKAKRPTVSIPTQNNPFECGGWWSVEPGLGRVAHGVADRVDRLKSIGNGQVPAVVRLASEILTKSVI